MAKEIITQEYLKSILHYDPVTGVFRNIRLNRVINTLNRGYVIINVKKFSYRAHRLAFLYMTGEWPKEDVDHINLNRSDNRWVNLRSCTHSDNAKNCKIRSHNKLGIKGVSKRSDRKTGYRAFARLNKKQICIGAFKTEEEAKQAYDNFVKKHYGEYYRLE